VGKDGRLVDISGCRADGRVAFIVQRTDCNLPADEENVLCGQLLTKETQIGNKEIREKTERKPARWSCCEDAVLFDDYLAAVASTSYTCRFTTCTSTNNQKQLELRVLLFLLVGCLDCRGFKAF